MRRGDWDIDARVHDMDLDGVYASVNFPSALPGFCGHRLQLGISDPELALAVDARRRTTGTSKRGPARTPTASSRARSRGCSTPRSRPTRSGATRRAASRRSRSPRTPSRSACRRSTPATGTRCSARARRPTPSCACTSGRRAPRPPRRATRRATRSACCSSASRCSPRSTGSTRRSRCASRTSRSCLSEGGIGWVAGLLDRLDHVGKYQAVYGTWEGIDLTPREVMQRNFWFCSLEDDAGLRRARPHRRRAHPRRDRLPAPRRHVARHAGAPVASAREAARAPTSARSRGRTRRTCSVTRYPSRSPRIPTASESRESSLVRHTSR